MVGIITIFLGQSRGRNTGVEPYIYSMLEALGSLWNGTSKAHACAIYNRYYKNAMGTFTYPLDCALKFPRFQKTRDSKCVLHPG